MEKFFNTNPFIDSDLVWGTASRKLVEEKIPKRSFIKFFTVPLIRGIGNFEFVQPDGKSGWGYYDGWNRSYHEAGYDPILYSCTSVRLKIP
jgi:hypothetical protein